MGALTVETVRSGTEWFAVDDPTAAGSARRAAMRLAERLGFDESRVGDVGIVASEAASNIVRHAVHGEIGLHVALTNGVAGVAVIAIDRGPGMGDVPFSSIDGNSTAGTLGVGLGAIGRLATSIDVSSGVGGTVLVATVWPVGTEVATGLDVGGVTRPIGTEVICGDAIAARETDGCHMVIVADGLGHGPLAAASSQEAVAVFHANGSTAPAVVLSAIHQRINHTRGAAIAVAAIDTEASKVTLAGVGNIAASICEEDRRQSLMSYPGIVGHQARTIRQFEFPFGPGAVLILHSDGVRDGWSLAATPGLARRSAELIAATVLRDAGSRPDDASVLVARYAR